MNTLFQFIRSFSSKTVLYFAAIAATAGSASAENVFENGLLVEAKNIDVSGELWDVKFVDGTCISVFGGCDSQQDFAFSTKQQADIAGAALLNQVIVGSISDSPWLIRGCDLSLDNCSIWTPY